MVIFDANFLLLFMQDNLPAPENPTTRETVKQCKERITKLISFLQESNEKIVIPTPVLAEILVRTDNASQEYLDIISKSSSFKIEPFDTRAAIEVSLITKEAINAGDKKSGSNEIWAKVKYDRQIIGIALACNISTIYTNDNNLRKIANRKNIKVIGVHELELPPQAEMDI